MSYDLLRTEFPNLPVVPTRALTTYVEAKAMREDLHRRHERELADISNAMETAIANVPMDAADREDLIAEARGTARRRTDAENSAYSSADRTASDRVNEVFDRLSDQEKLALSGEIPEIVGDADAATRINRFIDNLDDVTKELIVDLNSQSASTSIDIAVGYIARSKYLNLPAHLASKIYALWNTQQDTETWANGLTGNEIVAVAAVNLPCFEGLPGQEFMALLRAQLCAILGAPNSVRDSRVRFHEVREVPPMTDPAVLKRITDWMKTNAHVVKSLRYFALNFICLSNHVLLTLRSHWKNDAQFNALWNNGFRGALLDSLLTSFSWDRASLLHDVIHPWGLWKLYQAHRDFVSKDICDNSLKLRFRGAACGTAAYTGAAALIEQMKATKLFDRFFVLRAEEVKQVKDTADAIRDSRDRFCLNHRFYGHAEVPKLPMASVQSIAPVLMAYRDVFLKNTSFKDIRAIARLAENADGVRKVLVEKMKNLVKDAATKIEDLV